MTILKLQNIRLQFSGASKPALENINFDVAKGDFVIVLGSNGSGKSTLLKLLHRHYQAETGEVYFLNKPIFSHSTASFSKDVAILTQDCSDSLFYDLTIYENFLLVKKLKSVKLTSGSNREFLQDYLYEFNPNLSKKLNALVRYLSGGEKQALALALCLLQPPALLLLDEHTSALDPKTSEQIMQLTQHKITEHNISCLLTTHNLNIALQYGNRILALRDGNIHEEVSAQQKNALTKEYLMTRYY